MKSETISSESVLPRPVPDATHETYKSVVMKLLVGVVVLVVLVSLLLAGMSLSRLIPLQWRDITYVVLGIFGYVAVDVLSVYTRWARQGPDQKDS